MNLHRPEWETAVTVARDLAQRNLPVGQVLYEAAEDLKGLADSEYKFCWISGRPLALRRIFHGPGGQGVRDVSMGEFRTLGDSYPVLLGDSMMLASSGDLREELSRRLADPALWMRLL